MFPRKELSVKRFELWIFQNKIGISKRFVALYMSISHISKGGVRISSRLLSLQCKQESNHIRSPLVQLHLTA